MIKLIIDTDREEILNALRALLNGFGVAFEEHTSYDPEFVAEIEQSMRQVSEGKTVNYEPGTDLWDLVNPK